MKENNWYDDRTQLEEAIRFIWITVAVMDGTHSQAARPLAVIMLLRMQIFLRA